MLHTLRPSPGSVRKRKRVARGSGAGGGTTAGRGTKGQHSRTGKGRNLGFEGGQVPLIMRQPKLGGFTRDRKVIYEVLSVGTLEERLPAGSYDLTALRTHRLVHGNRKVKLLRGGALTKKFALTVHAASRSAKEAIEKAGGSVTITQ